MDRPTQGEDNQDRVSGQSMPPNIEIEHLEHELARIFADLAVRRFNALERRSAEPVQNHQAKSQQLNPSRSEIQPRPMVSDGMSKFGTPQSE